MSWQLSIADVDKSEISDLSPDPQTAPEGCEQAAAEQIDAVLEALENLAGVVGRPGDKLIVSLSGHANPDHGPCEGWADERISITITAHPAPPAVDEDGEG